MSVELNRAGSLGRTPYSVRLQGRPTLDGLIGCLFPDRQIWRKSGVVSTSRRYSSRLSRWSSVKLVDSSRLGRLCLAWRCISVDSNSKARHVYIQLAPSSLRVLITSRRRDFTDCCVACCRWARLRGPMTVWELDTDDFTHTQQKVNRKWCKHNSVSNILAVIGMFCSAYD